jgi:hypothetical protein
VTYERAIERLRLLADRENVLYALKLAELTKEQQSLLKSRLITIENELIELFRP